MKELLLSLLCFCALTPLAQLQINEYSCSNSNGPIDAFGENEDWAELYNSGATPIDLGGYYLSDKASDLSKWEIPPGVSIPSNGFAKILFSGRGEISGDEIHAGFKLTQTKNEWIILTSGGGSVIDSLQIVHLTQKNHSYGRMTDGSESWGIFTSPNFGSTNVGASNYYSAKPTMSVAPGFYPSTQTVSINSTDATATIHYTLNGTVPTIASPTYTGPLTVSSTTIIKARGFSSDPAIPPSFIETNTYFINATHTIPVLSVSGNEITDFITDAHPEAFFSNFDGAFEFFEADGSLAAEGEGYYNKHGNDSWAYDQRGFDFIMRDEYGYDYAVQHQIFPGKDRDEFKRIMVKAAANDNYSFEDGGAHLRDSYIHTMSQEAGLRMDERTSRFVIVYINGEYWGVYDIREKVDDHDFTDHYYDQDRNDLYFIKTWGGTWAEYGGAAALADWNDLYTYITSNDMSIPANYEYVTERYNVGSLIDYIVLNSYTVTSDWLNYNTGWWRGLNPDGDKKKWRYILWDMDASFGHYINYTGVPSTDADADPCNPETLAGDDGSDPEGHITILQTLRENEDFNYYYISRFIDLSNSALSCESMIHLLDSMAAVISPEMNGQIDRWGGTFAEWEDNVQEIRDFLEIRCEAIEEGLKDCYDLEGPYDLLIDVAPANSGEVKINSEWVGPYDWTGTYYGGINTVFRARAADGFEFDYWESLNHTFGPEDRDTLNLMSGDTIIAHFKPIEVIVDEEDDPDNPGNPKPPVITDIESFHLPTGFSPNGDSYNDVLQFYVGDDVETFQLIIVDRWGKTVFMTQSRDLFWDGTFNNKLLNSGVYAYYLTYSSSITGFNKKTGNVTLIR